MKTFKILILILFFKTFFIQAQDTIKGIGYFQLNKTTISELKKIYNLTNHCEKVDIGLLGDISEHHGLTALSHIEDIHYKLGNFQEIKPHFYENWENASIDTVPDNIKIFFAKKALICGLAIQDIFFIFFNDSLIKIEGICTKQLGAAFELKYGQGGYYYDKLFDGYLSWRKNKIQAYIDFQGKRPYDNILLGFFEIFDEQKLSTVFNYLNECHDIKWSRLEKLKNIQKTKNDKMENEKMENFKHNIKNKLNKL